MSRIDIEVRYVGPSDGSLICAAFMFFGGLGGWWALYVGLGLTTPDWLAFSIAWPLACLVGFIVGGWYDERRAPDGR